MKAAVTESLCYYELKQQKQRFDKKYSRLLDETG
jgi:hypothetical protein